jgi:hypothetical protein
VKPKVLNRHVHGEPAGAVYVGRGTPWGNPYVVGRDGTHDEVVAKYSALLERSPDLRAKIREELAGKDLVCSCKPKRCHGDAILKIANGKTKT